MKRLIVIPILLLTAGCGLTGSSDGVEQLDDGTYCFDGYSYIRIEGQILPSVSTAQGFEDYACPQG